MAGFLVFDIETVIDEELFRKTAKKNQIERFEDPDDDYFVPAIYHVPVAVSMLYTTNNPEPVIFKNEKPYYFFSLVSNSPIRIVDKFFKTFKQVVDKNRQEGIISEYGRNNEPIYHPVLVSHNGLQFDLPVMYMWGLKFQDVLSDKAREGLRELLNDEDSFENTRPNYRKRFSKFQIDTIEFFVRSGLKAVCHFYGIEVKSEAEGSEVDVLFKNGEFEKIGLYCAEDVTALAKVVNLLLKAKGDNGLYLPEDHRECEVVLEVQ
ncbi:hypothetical protein [Persephonella sp.]